MIEITVNDMLENALEQSASAAQQRRIRDDCETRELVLDFIVTRSLPCENDDYLPATLCLDIDCECTE